MTPDAADWKADLLRALRPQLSCEENAGIFGLSSSAVHLAVVAEPYLDLILRGDKTVETRWSRVRCAPYNRADAGDFILMKEPSRPVAAMARVARAEFYDLESADLKQLNADIAAAACITDCFWSNADGVRWLSALWLTSVGHLSPIPCRKRSRAGWVIVRERKKPSVFVNRPGASQSEGS